MISSTLSVMLCVRDSSVFVSIIDYCYSRFHVCSQSVLLIFSFLDLALIGYPSPIDAVFDDLQTPRDK